jgi:hypothetical protein
MECDLNTEITNVNCANCFITFHFTTFSLCPDLLQDILQQFPNKYFRIFLFIVWLLYLQIPMQSVPITAKVVSSNPAHSWCTRYNIMQ